MSKRLLYLTNPYLQNQGPGSRRGHPGEAGEQEEGGDRAGARHRSHRASAARAGAAEGHGEMVGADE